MLFFFSSRCRHTRCALVTGVHTCAVPIFTAPRVLLYVQNLRGIGHLRRAAAVARGLIAEGMAVDFVSGGMPVPHLPLGGAELIQLPPVRALDDAFKVLVDEHARPIDDGFRAQRPDRPAGLVAPPRTGGGAAERRGGKEWVQE